MGKKARDIALTSTHRQTVPQSVLTSDRCRATHDVPHTLRCTLRADHVTRVVRDAIVTGGELAGARVVVYEPHKDKNGREW